MSAKEDPRGSIIAAEIAVCERDLDTAENALLEALGRVRKARGGGSRDD